VTVEHQVPTIKQAVGRNYSCCGDSPKLARDKTEFFAHGRVFGTTTFTTLKNFAG
jgi:hypothetical protein